MPCFRFRTVLFVISFFSLYSVSGQTLTTPDLNKSLIPPSPDAASLGTYGVLPVTLYSGLPALSVPVSELKSSKLSVAVSLTYNYNGYRPGMEASSVGLGWSLQAGGMITRVVKGINDEYPGQGGTYLYKWQMYANILDMTSNMDFMAAVGNHMADTEPDIYIFNFNGHSGKFILVGSQAYLFPAQDLLIKQVGSGFTITDEQGVIYSFQDQETTIPNNSTSPGSYMPTYTSAWYLTKMTTPDNTDEIDFRYSSWMERQSNAAYQESYQRQVGGLKGGLASCSGDNNGCDTWSQIDYMGGAVTAKQLTQISCKAGYINFVPETTVRQDLNSDNAYGLKEIDVYQPDSLLLKKVGLTHSYFGGGGSSTTELKLTAVSTTGYFVNTTQGGSGTTDSISTPNYTFQYNGGNMPKGTRGLDNWGYYNGHDENAMLFDSTIVPYQALYSFANRSVNTTAGIAGTMSDVYYPTGGHTHFTYEGNLVGYPGDHRKRTTKYAGATAYYIASNGDTTINGTVFTLDSAQTIQLSYGRTLIAADTTFGAINDHLIVRIYSISGQDTVGAPPPQLVYTSPRLNKSVTSNMESIGLQSGIYSLIVVAEATDINSFATVSYVWLDSTYLGDPGPGVRVKTITSYDNLNSAPVLTKNYAYALATVLSASGTYGSYSVQHQYTNSGCGSGGTYMEYVFSSSYSSPLSTLVDNQFFYPRVTEVNADSTGSGKTVYEYIGNGTDALGVELYRQTEYKYQNGGFLPVHQKVNTYSPTNLINFQAFTYNVSMEIDPSGCLVPPLTTPNQLDTIGRYVLYNPNSYILGSFYNYLTATDELTFDQNGTNPLTVHTDYYYDNPNYFQPSRTVTANSKGYPITTQVKYPLDYSYVSCTPLYTIDTAFKSARDAASINYEECTISRYNAAISYWNPSIQNSANTALLNVLRGYPCENTYSATYASAISALNTNVAAHFNCLLGNLLPDAQAAVVNMQYGNIKTIPVEQIVTINRNGDDYLFGANKTDFTVNHPLGASPNILYRTKVAAANIAASLFQTNPGNYYEPRVNFVYDNLDNILQQAKTSDMPMSYIWDYHRLYPIAQASNADTGNIAYTSFEADGSGGWNIGAGSVDQTTSITGNASYSLASGSITRPGLNSNTTYFVSYWTTNSASFSVPGTMAGYPVQGKTEFINNRNWTLYVHKVTGQNAISVSGSGHIDELRLYPATAQMTTYTYAPLIGMTAQTDLGNRTTYYQYDPLGRLKRIRDQDYNILKTFDYQYQTPSGCGSGCTLLAMQTFLGTGTPGYPVGVFDVHGTLIGNATGASAYVSLWNGDTADSRIGTLAVGPDSLHFGLSVATGQTAPAGVTGCRYYQYDLPWNIIDGVTVNNCAYVDFGDGARMRMPLTNTIGDTLYPLAPNTTRIGFFSQFDGVYWFIHTYPDTTLKTITLYHNDVAYYTGLDNANSPATSLTKVRNLRGNFPQSIQAIGGSCYQQASALSLANVTNWSSISSVTQFWAHCGDRINPSLNLNYVQDFMAGNRNLQVINTTQRTYYQVGYWDSAFKLSRLKSDWNTYFTNLQDIEICDAHWNREDLSALTQLSSFYLVPDNQNHSNNSTGNPTIPIPASSIDNILNQIAAGAGQNISNGVIWILTGGSGRTAASNAAVTALDAKGWLIYLDSVQQ